MRQNSHRTQTLASFSLLFELECAPYIVALNRSSGEVFSLRSTFARHSLKRYTRGLAE